MSPKILKEIIRVFDRAARSLTAYFCTSSAGLQTGCRAGLQTRTWYEFTWSDYFCTSSAGLQTGCRAGLQTRTWYEFTWSET